MGGYPRDAIEDEVRQLSGGDGRPDALKGPNRHCLELAGLVGASVCVQVRSRSSRGGWRRDAQGGECSKAGGRQRRWDSSLTHDWVAAALTDNRHSWTVAAGDLEAPAWRRTALEVVQRTA